MKRLVISIIWSIVLVFGYFYSLGLLYQIFHLSFETLAILLLPLNFPYNIYKSIFGVYYGDPAVVKMWNYVAAALIYAVPFYLIFTLYGRIKDKAKKQISAPPEPPVF